LHKFARKRKEKNEGWATRREGNSAQEKNTHD